MKAALSSTNLKKENELNCSEYHSHTLREIIFLICNGKSSKQIAKALCYSKKTIDKYREHISTLTDTKNAAEIINYAIIKGIYNDNELINKFGILKLSS